MKLSKVAVEQVRLDGQIVEDYGEILNPIELTKMVNDDFGTHSYRNGISYGSYEGKEFCLLYKNVSYLGIPHPIFKKRIQIPHSFLDIYFENLKRNIPTFFIGVYKYKENVIYVNFDTEKYIQNKGHNSSAHVLAIDLAYATTNAFHFKKDIRDNEIFCFTSSAIGVFFNMYLSKTIDKMPEMFKVFNRFYDSTPSKWNGIDCYKEMMDSKYHRCNQPEWPGAYLEYLFEAFLDNENSFVNGFVKYAPTRGKDGIDLDLLFPRSEERGDLKAHSNTTGAIPGNKTSTIEECIKNGKSVYYIIFTHETVLDKDKHYAVTEYWNTRQNKPNLHSYGSRMKHSVHLTGYMIIEINERNFHYLNLDFQKGFKNSDGKPRTPKISIGKKELPNFIIHEYDGTKH